MLDYNTYISGDKPQNLVIFLHGYNGNIADHQYAIDWLRQNLKSALIVVPQAPQPCDKNPLKKQWFGMLKYDPENKRRLDQTSLEDIFSIYNKAAKEIEYNSLQINDFIDYLQQKYGFTDAATYLIGFSQGAILAADAALRRKQPLAGAFVIAGLLAADKALAQHLNSKPPLYLFHGEDDMKVQYKTLPVSCQWLQEHQVDYKTYTYPHLAHQISVDEIKKIAAIINDKSV